MLKNIYWFFHVVECKRLPIFVNIFVNRVKKRAKTRKTCANMADHFYLSFFEKAWFKVGVSYICNRTCSLGFTSIFCLWIFHSMHQRFQRNYFILFFRMPFQDNLGGKHMSPRHMKKKRIVKKPIDNSIFWMKDKKGILFELVFFTLNGFSPIQVLSYMEIRALAGQAWPRKEGVP